MRRQGKGHHDGTHPACVDCGSTGGGPIGGGAGTRHRSSWRLCANCQKYHGLRGTLGRFPRTTNHLKPVTIPTGYLAPSLLAAKPSRPGEHAVIAAGWDWLAVVREAEAFAAAYLAARQQRAA